MAVGADVLDARPPELEHSMPRPGLDRHPQAAQADTAAILLVPDGEPKAGIEKEENQQRDQRIPKAEPEARRKLFVAGVPNILRFPGQIQQRQQAVTDSSNPYHLAGKVRPVA